MTRFIRVEATGLEGAREISAAGWDGQVLRMSRDAFLKWRKAGAEKLGKACVYILFADDFSRTTANQRFLSVGHISATPQPVDSQDKEKAFWSVALVFTSAGNWMTTGQARTVEAIFIDWARDAGRYEVANRAVPEDRPSADDLVQAYLAPIKTVLEFAGIDVFQFNREGLFTLSRGPKFGKLDRAKARVVPAAVKTIEIYQDSRLGVNKLPEIIEKVQALVDAGAATFDGDVGVVTFIRPTRVIASGAFDTLLGTFPKDWTNASRRSIQDVFDDHKGARQPATRSFAPLPMETDGEQPAPAGMTVPCPA
jgi:hypothetical protein